MMDKQLVSLVGISLLSFFTQMVPLNFMPKIYEIRDIPSIFVAVVLSIYPLGQFISSLLVVSLFQKFQKKNIVLISMLAQVFFIFLFGSINLIKIQENTKYLVNILFIIVQFMTGCCCGTQITVMISYIPEKYPKEIQRISSLVDSSILLGSTIGISISGGLYYLFQEYYLTFYIMAFIQFIFIFPFVSQLQKSEQNQNQNQQNIQISKLLKNYQFCSTILQLFVIFLSDIIVLNLISNLIKDQSMVSILLFTFNIIYIIVSVLTGILFKNTKILIIMSGLFTLLTFVILGGFFNANFTQSETIQYIVAVLCSIGSAFITQSVAQQSFQIGIQLYQNPEQNDQINDIVSGFLICVITLSEMLGPLFFQLINQNLKLYQYCFIIIIILTISILFYISFNMINECRKRDLKDEFLISKENLKVDI